jgi:hypothetical protein
VCVCVCVFVCVCISHFVLTVVLLVELTCAVRSF